MPTYVYACPNGHVTEKFEPMSASAEQPCPECPQPPFEDHENEDEPYCLCKPTMMTRQFAPGVGGFSFKGGPPTRRFHRRG